VGPLDPFIGGAVVQRDKPMTEPAIFIFGVFITIIVIAAIGSLLWAAYEDGERQERKEADIESS
jgi:hypothetical protein